MLTNRWKSIALFSVFTCILTSPVKAQTSYPTQRPVSLVVPITPGGPNDIVARFIAEQLGKRMDGNFIVENRPGASHIIGMTHVARARPDGYTLLQASSNLSMNPAVRNDLPFDSESDFQAVSFTHETPLVVTVSTNLKINTFTELVDLIKRDPTQISYGTTGEGSSQRMASLLLMSKLGQTGLQEIAYKGSTQAHPDLIANRITFMIDPLAAVLPHVKDGRLKILAITTKERLSLLPDVPTVAEELKSDYTVTSWGGIFTPKNAPKEIVQQLNKSLVAILTQDATKQRLLELGLIAKSSSPEELAAHVSSEIMQWKKLVQANK